MLFLCVLASWQSVGMFAVVWVVLGSSGGRLGWSGDERLVQMQQSMFIRGVGQGCASRAGRLGPVASSPLKKSANWESKQLLNYD